MSTSFNCPNCGAPLDYPAKGKSIRCTFCNSSVLVPPNPDNNLPTGGTSPQAAATPQVIIQLVQAGRKIEAIKLYREATGVGLAEAKTAVEVLAGERVANHTPAGVDSPKQTAAKSVGCTILWAGLALSVVFSVLLGFGAVLWQRMQPAIAFPTVVAIATIGNTVATPLPFVERVLTVGQPGNRAGSFSDLRAVAIDGQNQFYGGEYLPSSVQAFAPDGTFLWQYQPSGENEYIKGLAGVPEGGVWVLLGINKVRLFDAAGKLQTEWQTDAWFDDIALAPNGDLLLVNDTQLARYDRNGGLLWQVGSDNDPLTRRFAADASLPTPRAVNLAVAGNGTLYLALDDGRLILFDANGQLLDQLSHPAATRLESIALDGQGRIAWGLGYAVLLTDAKGETIAQFETGFLSDLAFTADGRLVGSSRQPQQQIEIYQFR